MELPLCYSAKNGSTPGYVRVDDHIFDSHSYVGVVGCIIFSGPNNTHYINHTPRLYGIKYTSIYNKPIYKQVCPKTNHCTLDFVFLQQHFICRGVAIFL